MAGNINDSGLLRNAVCHIVVVVVTLLIECSPPPVKNGLSMVLPLRIS